MYELFIGILLNIIMRTENQYNLGQSWQLSC